MGFTREVCRYSQPGKGTCLLGAPHCMLGKNMVDCDSYNGDEYDNVVSRDISVILMEVNACAQGLETAVRSLHQYILAVENKICTDEVSSLLDIVQSCVNIKTTVEDIPKESEAAYTHARQLSKGGK